MAGSKPRVADSWRYDTITGNFMLFSSLERGHLTKNIMRLIALLLSGHLAMTLAVAPAAENETRVDRNETRTVPSALVSTDLFSTRHTNATPLVASSGDA